ncbi:MAG: sugar phosphate isomerase/epimerase family protein [Candidatus Cyclobacteriaceae bacterium M2_1C_046]
MASGLALPATTLGNSLRLFSSGGISDFGIQLYSVKEAMAADPKGTLKAISSYGYKHIESFEGSSGMFWGMSNTDFKAFVEDLGMEIVASHCNTEENFESKAEKAAEIGMKYLISPWIGPQETIEGYKAFADKFNHWGKICKQNGLGFAYHNHAYTFKETEGKIPQKVLMDSTDPDLVDFELDIYWVVAGGADPIEYLKNYENRFRLCHVKDYKKKNDTEGHSTVLGTGIINWKEVLKTAQENGMKYFIVEQEDYTNTKPLVAIQENAKYLKNLKL